MLPSPSDALSSIHPLIPTAETRGSRVATGLYQGRFAPPRSGHSITVCAGDKAIVFGGCGVNAQGAQEVFSDTWNLSTVEPFTWELADVMGDVPVARWRHTATLLPDSTVLIFGGLCK